MLALDAWVPIRAVIREPMAEAAHGDARLMAAIAPRLRLRQPH
jgi:hypothetical protein